MNKVELLGRLTKDPNFSETSEYKKATYTLAVHKGKTTDFIPCIAFGKCADIAKEYFQKGTQIAVVGCINTGRYEKDDQTQYTFNVIINEQYFIDKTKKPLTDPNGYLNFDDIDESELPFH